VWNKIWNSIFEYKTYYKIFFFSVVCMPLTAQYWDQIFNVKLPPFFFMTYVSSQPSEYITVQFEALLPLQEY